MTDDFANYPKSIAEVKATQANEWTPRDVLISVLRAIDSGEINPDTLLVIHRNVDSKGTRTRYASSGPDIHTSLGMMEVAKSFMLKDGTDD